MRLWNFIVIIFYLARMRCYARHLKHYKSQTNLYYLQIKNATRKIVYWVHEMSTPPPTAIVVLLLLFFSRVYSLVHIESLKDIYILVCPCGIYGYAISVSLLWAYKIIVKVLSFLPVFAVNSWNRLWALGRLIALSCVWIYSLGIQFVFGFYH